MYTISDRFDTWLILSGTTGSRQYHHHESTMVWRNVPLYYLLKCLLPLSVQFSSCLPPLCHALFVEKDTTKYQKLWSSQPLWSLFNGTWQKRPRELDHHWDLRLKKWHSKCAEPCQQIWYEQISYGFFVYAWLHLRPGRGHAQARRQTHTLSCSLTSREYLLEIVTMSTKITHTESLPVQWRLEKNTWSLAANFVGSRHCAAAVCCDNTGNVHRPLYFDIQV